MTCPSGTYGVVNGNNGDPSLNYTRNCTTSKCSLCVITIINYLSLIHVYIALKWYILVYLNIYDNSMITFTFYGILKR